MSIWKLVTRHKWFLGGIFVVSLVLRTVVVFGYFAREQRYWNADTRMYYEMAHSSAAGLGFANSDGNTTFYRVPGYPLFFAAIYFVFGNNDCAVLGVQVVLSSLVSVLLCILSLVMFSARVRLAYGVGFWGSMHPGLIIFSGLLMTEILCTVLFVWFAIVFFRSYALWGETPSRNVSLSTWGYIGLLVGLVGIVRPVGHYLLGVVVMLLLVSAGTAQRSLKCIVSVCAGWLVVLGPWLVRNYLLTGALFIHTLGGFHFLQHLAARVEMHHQHISYHDALHGLMHEYDAHKKKLLAQGREFGEHVQSSLARDIAFSHMMRRPLHSMRLAGINMLKTVLSLYSGELLSIEQCDTPPYSATRGVRDSLARFLLPRVKSWWVIPFIYSEIILYGFILLGLICSLTLLGRDRVYMYAFVKSMPFIGLFIFISLACGIARLRLPVELLMGILSLRYWIGERRKRKVV